MKFTNSHRFIKKLILSATFSFLSVVAYSFNLDIYTDASVLSNGDWLKISVKETGIHFIPRELLAKWGFASIDRIMVCGYGGRQLPDNLLESEYIDDLPHVPLFRNEKGIYFYAVGPLDFEMDDAGFFQRTLNPYSDYGFYFISQSDTQLDDSISTGGIAARSQESQSSFIYPVLHEIEQVNYGSSGRTFLGEDFRTVPSRSFSFDLPELIEQSEVNVICSFASRTTSDSYLSFSINGSPVSGFEKVVMPPTSGGNYGLLKKLQMAYIPGKSDLNLGITFLGGGIVKAANLDYILVNYLRNITVPQKNSIQFVSPKPGVTIDDGLSGTHVWDITDPLKITEVRTESINGKRSWISDFSGKRKYTVWNENSSFPTPSLVSRVDNQNLHNSEQTPQMVIVSVNSLIQKAEEIARIHREMDGMDVLVVSQDLIFNEFSSGSRDPNSFRKYLKMLYDRNPETLKYVLFLGRGNFDNRGLTSEGKMDTGILMPVWESEESMIEAVSFTTDDFYAQLEDNAGLRPESDTYSIAVGRIPARSVAEASEYISKLNRYLADKSGGEWMNRVIMLADDGDSGAHLTQAENEIISFASSASGKSKLFEKIYLDSYSLKGGICSEAREILLRQLDKGAVWWTYNGHANKYYLTGQGVMTLNDINSLRNKKFPVFFGATCYFMQWDNNEQSGAEKLFFNENGGIIAGITATRPVFISENALIANAMAKEAFREGENNSLQSIGLSLRNAKNTLSSAFGTSNGNKLRYGLMGDPAMKIAGNTNSVVLDSIDNQKFNETSGAVVQGRSKYRFYGKVVDCDNKIMDDFSGKINISFYDADKSVTTKGRDIDGTKGKQLTYDIHGDLLFLGSDSVAHGLWAIDVILPEDISDNFRPASVLLSAEASHDHASSLIRSIFVSGLSEDYDPDTVPPVIEEFYLNEPSFRSGDRVNSSPVLFIKVSDDTGINLSNAGIGRNMVLKLDRNQTFNDVAMFFTPNVGGKPGGTIAFPLSDLKEGSHTLAFRVSDTSGNIAEAEISFVVDDRLAPEILDIYTDENPASANVNFYLVHNRPDALLTITLSVYSLSGNLVWSSTINDRSDMLVSSPIKWNLLDRGGRRVPRGIYIYRAEVTCNNVKVLSPARRLAVTGR